MLATRRRAHVGLSRRSCRAQRIHRWANAPYSLRMSCRRRMRAVGDIHVDEHIVVLTSAAAHENGTVDSPA